MTLIFQLIVLTSIWVMGLTIITQPKMLAEKVRDWADGIHKKGNKFMEPLILCHWCMPSLHSAVGYTFAVLIGLINHFEWRLVFMYPLVAMGSSLLNGIVWGLHKLIEAATGYYSNAEQLTHFDIRDRKAEHQQKKAVKKSG